MASVKERNDAVESERIQKEARRQLAVERREKLGEMEARRRDAKKAWEHEK
ncbi:9055_t:CDS:1, partial [Acaulospora colombiana]